MTNREQLIQEIEQAPDALIEEVLDFYLFLKQRQQAKDEAQADTSELSFNGILNLLEQVKDIQSQVPAEEWEKLPHDGSINHDHYLYGAPKVEE
ncbi:MAG: DUF2281 domain-containing protein [Almyronema sp.]